MSCCRSRMSAMLLTTGLILPGAALALDEVPLRNWTVPGASGGPQKGFAPTADLGYPGLFVPVTPCRVADTRNAAGAYGGPALSANVSRAFNIQAGPCTGIPAGAVAYSLNFTVVGSAGVYAGAFLSAWATGGLQPTVSTLNFNGGQVVANAAIVPAAGNSITVLANTATHLIIDVNGYYVSQNSVLTSGEYVGIYGNSDPTWTSLLYVRNYSTAGNTSAVRGNITSVANNTAGVVGEQFGASGLNYAVKGTNSSATNGSAGVYGVSGLTTGGAVLPAGVRGESTTGNGVVGLSRAAGTASVGGYRVNVSGGVLTMGVLGYDSLGVYYEGGIGGIGTKAFLEPHPTDATKMISYVALEGPEAGTYFRGRGRFVGGTARIEVPETFRMVTDPEGLTVQLTPIGRATAVGVVRMGLDYIEVEAIRDVEFSYLVQGVRKAYRDVQPVLPNTAFRPNSAGDRMSAALSPDERQRLIDNGTYNADGTVNLSTAERVGWARAWRERDAEARAIADRTSHVSNELGKGGSE